MKYSLVLLGPAICAFVIGCGTQGVNDPAENAVDGSIAKSLLPQEEPNLIKFDQVAVYTNGDRSGKVVRAMGKVSFQIRGTPIMHADFVDVDIAVKGELYSDEKGKSSPWFFGGSSTDRILAPITAKAALQRTYKVYGADVPTTLTMEFTVTQKTLALRAITLTVEEKEPIADVRDHP